MNTPQLIAAGVSALFAFGTINLVNAQSVETPADVAEAPAGAEKTASGLASKVLKEGTGTEKPRSFDSVTVHYSGWTTDGKLFDSSVQRGQTTSFPLNQVIKGWTEGLQLMVVGEKRRFWIPAELAYGENPGGGRPGGMLCFDVELFDIQKGEEPPKAPEDAAAPVTDAKKSPAGIAYQVLEAGEGDVRAAEHDKVTLHYSVWAGEQLLESSKTRGEAIPVAPGQVPVEAWKEALLSMAKGERRLLWLTQEQAFGDNAPPHLSSEWICFELEVHAINKMPEPPKAPVDVASPPSDAEKTSSGLASKVLQQGSGTKKPQATDTVEVHYSGWTTDGKMFDSSVARGQTASFPLNQVIKGWTEGLQLMVEGEKRRFWIPAELAYGENPGGGRPGGMLCFDVELISIK